MNIVGVGCCAFLLLSFAVLPVEYTYRHYMSVCLALAIMIMQMSPVIPMGNQSSQCFDKITPHDMYSSINCALSGAFLLGGGWCTVMWGTFFAHPQWLPKWGTDRKFGGSFLTHALFASSDLLAGHPRTALLP